MELALREMAEFLRAKVVGDPGDIVVRRISTDSRTIQPGDCFVALKGTAFDGHDFASDAAAVGAIALVVHYEIPSLCGVVQLVVDDTLYALGELARLWRRKCRQIRLAALVGSSGKTTVKEMTAAILGRRMSTLATEGNLNNLIGVPQTLFRFQLHHEAAVVELGMNQPGELARLVQIADPNCVALLNIRNAHIGMFSSPDELYRAKTESLVAAPAHATFVLNADDPLSQRAFAECVGSHRVIRFGLSAHAQVRATSIRPLVPFGYRFTLELEGERPTEATLHMFGQHNVVNALAAAAVAHLFGVGPDDIAAALAEFRSAANRSEVEEVSGIYFVKDYYNASPAAVEAALMGLRDFSIPGRAYAVLGDMLELGAWEQHYHAQVGRVAAQVGLQKLFCFGPRSRVTAQAAEEAGLRAEHFDDIEALGRALLREIQVGDLVLIKASRLMRLERLYEFLKGALATGPQ